MRDSSILFTINSALAPIDISLTLEATLTLTISDPTKVMSSFKLGILVAGLAPTFQVERVFQSPPPVAFEV